jgi:hypothetical protein
MTAEEKAKELVKKYIDYMPSVNEYYQEHEPDEDSAKECALITVDEILNSTPLTSYPKSYIEKHGIPVGSKDWWKEVRTEIEKL